MLLVQTSCRASLWPVTLTVNFTSTEIANEVSASRVCLDVCPFLTDPVENIQYPGLFTRYFRVSNRGDQQ